MNIKIDALNYYGATKKKYHLHFPALREDIEADVVIIGGGFSGINTALELAEQGITNVVVLEARHLGYGGTGRNGGQVMAGIGHDIEAVKKHVGKEGLETLFKIANLGAGIIRERIRKYNIDADFVPGYGYLAYNQRQLKTLRRWEKEFEATADEEIELYTGKEVQQVVGSEVYCGALKHMGGGQIHSLNMLLGSAQAAPLAGGQDFRILAGGGGELRQTGAGTHRDGQRQSRQTAVGLRQFPQQYGAGDLQQRWSLTPTRCRPSRSPMN
ncbi:NAD(P)/FAD-dependent oxidoreductase [Klebsiella pneumoniae]